MKQDKSDILQGHYDLAVNSKTFWEFFLGVADYMKYAEGKKEIMRVIKKVSMKHGPSWEPNRLHAFYWSFYKSSERFKTLTEHDDNSGYLYFQCLVGEVKILRQFRENFPNHYHDTELLFLIEKEYRSYLGRMHLLILDGLDVSESSSQAEKKFYLTRSGELYCFIADEKQFYKFQEGAKLMAIRELAAHGNFVTEDLAKKLRTSKGYLRKEMGDLRRLMEKKFEGLSSGEFLPKQKNGYSLGTTIVIVEKN